MSEARFLNQHIQTFASAHPHEAGWKAYEFPGEVVHRLSLHLLLDFVQERHPESVKRRTTIKGLLEAHFVETDEVSDRAELRLEQELTSDSWYGSIDIEWVGHQIHFVSVLVKYNGGFSTVYHVATQSNEALRTFTQALDAYGQSRNKADARHILVINGPDIPVTPVSWEDIFLPPGLLEDIRRNVVMFFESEARYRELGIPYRRGLLLAGAPGCGKTLTLKALAHHTSAKFITVLGKSDVTDGEIQRALDAAEQFAPAVVVFEDLDKLIGAKGISLSHFLNLLDGLKTLSGVLVIATSNEPEKLDPALLHRPSRFDRIWTVPLPGFEQRLALLQKRGGIYFSEPALRDVAQRAQGFSMTYVQEIIVSTLLECAHSGKHPSDQDLMESLATLRAQRRSVSKEMESLEERETVGFSWPR